MSILWLRNVCMGLSYRTNVCFLHVSEAHCVGLFTLDSPSSPDRNPEFGIPGVADLILNGTITFYELNLNNPILAGFLLPLGIISIAYTFIFIRTRRLQMGERGDRVNRMIILVVVSFFITWLPNQMITFYLVVTPDEQINNSALYKISPFSQVIIHCK